jgi:rod shape-determining protein MreB
MAAAIGAGLDVMEPEGRMIVDIGGGTTEIAVISLGGIVINRSIRTAGDEFDEAIIAFARIKYGLVIGQPTAEEVKEHIGSAFMSAAMAKKIASGAQKELYFVVRGRDMATGLPRSLRFSSTEIREAIAPVVRHIITGITETLEETPPELVADILDHGIVLAGGTSLLRGLDALIAEETQMSVVMSPDPMLAVVKGAAKALENPKLLNRVKIVGGLR